MKSRPRRRKRYLAGSIFEGASDRWQLNASINWLQNPEHMRDTYATGYLETALYLGRALMRRRPPMRLFIDSCIYPLVFLWRHYLELRMKELITSLSALVDQPTPTLSRVHDLGTLWGWLRPLLDARSIPAEDLRRADQIFRDFTKVDSTSQAFRYHEDTQGQRSAAGVRHVNVARLHRVMQDLSELLEGSSIAASIESAQRAEMAEWYRGSAE